MAKIVRNEKTPEEKADWERKLKRAGILTNDFDVDGVPASRLSLVFDASLGLDAADGCIDIGGAMVAASLLLHMLLQQYLKIVLQL